MKKFCEYLKEYTIEIISFEKKKTIPLTKEQRKLHEKSKSVTFAKKNLYKSTLKIKTIVKLGTIVIIQVNT